jgi:hypothetical protein
VRRFHQKADRHLDRGCAQGQRARGLIPRRIERCRTLPPTMACESITRRPAAAFR